MHVKALLSVGAATASLLAGTAGSALLGHAAAAPQHKVGQPAPHHTSATNHTAGTKGRNGTPTKTTAPTKGNVAAKPKPKPKAKAKATPKPTPKATATPTPVATPPHA